MYENAQEIAHKTMSKSVISKGTETAVNLGPGLLAGFAAAFVSQPADTVLSNINKISRLPGEGIIIRLLKIAKELGLQGRYNDIIPH